MNEDMEANELTEMKAHCIDFGFAQARAIWMGLVQPSGSGGHFVIVHHIRQSVS